MTKNINDFINNLNLEPTSKARLKLNYSQLQAIYNFFELNEYHYEHIKYTYNISLEKIFINKINYGNNSESEEVTWFSNIKNTYEMLNKYSSEELKDIIIYFEYNINYEIPFKEKILTLNNEKKIGNTKLLKYKERIDTLIQKGNTYLIIEYSHQTKQNESKLLKIKNNQVKDYMIHFILENFDNILIPNYQNNFFINQTVFIDNLPDTIITTEKKLKNLINNDIENYYNNETLKKLKQIITQVTENLFFLEDFKYLKGLIGEESIIPIRKCFKYYDEFFYYIDKHHETNRPPYTTINNEDKILKIESRELTDIDLKSHLNGKYEGMIIFLLKDEIAYNIFNN